MELSKGSLHPGLVGIYAGTRALGGIIIVLQSLTCLVVKYPQHPPSLANPGGEQQLR